MKIQCSRCGVQGYIDAAKIPSQGAKISCPRCRKVFSVKKEELPLASPLKSEEVPIAPQKSEVLMLPQSEEDLVTASQEADAATRQGMEFFKKRMFKEALESFQKVVELNPRHPDGYRNLGVLYGQKKMWSEAVNALEKALKVNPNDLQSQKNLGVLYLQQKNFEGALSALGKALALNPRDEKAQIYMNLALKGQKKSKRQGAGGEPMEEPMEEKPMEGGTGEGPLEGLMEERLMEAGAEEGPTGGLVEESKQIPEVNVGGVREKVEVEASEPSIQGLAEPNLPEQPSKEEPAKKSKVSSLLDEACDLLDSQKPRDAITKCKEALEIEPNNPSIYFMMGLIYEERRMWDQAAEAYEKTLQLNPDHEDAQRNLTLIKKQRKQPLWKRIWGRN